jgi:hypothetical protein
MGMVESEIVSSKCRRWLKMGHAEELNGYGIFAARQTWSTGHGFVVMC